MVVHIGRWEKGLAVCVLVVTRRDNKRHVSRAAHPTADEWHPHGGYVNFIPALTVHDASSDFRFRYDP